MTGSPTAARSADGSHPPGAGDVALVPAAIIARLRGPCTSDAAGLSWDWAMRAGGQVVRRMAAVNGPRERNPWPPVTRVPATGRQLVRADPTHAEAVLAGIARRRGHEIGQPFD